MTRRIRQGFTLVELLVVIAIMVVLYGLMLARLAPGAGRQCRDAANALATALNEAWSRGLGNPAGSALVIESAGNTSVSLASASVPPPIEGSVAGPVGGSVSVLNATDPAGLANGSRIQFFRTGSGAVPPSPWFGYANGVLSLRAAAGQTADNTIWPIGDGLQCRVLCRPVKAERVAVLPKMAAIDLRSSGIESNAAYASLAGKGDITVAFDGFGGVAGLWVAGVEVPPAPVYFLVAAQADIERSQAAPLASGVSRWVVVSPQSGRVTVAANNPADTVAAARAFARPGASSGR
jgi:prepilin-type N-terminal cleavage/methylation domain-containing protein